MFLPFGNQLLAAFPGVFTLFGIVYSSLEEYGFRSTMLAEMVVYVKLFLTDRALVESWKTADPT